MKKSLPIAYDMKKRSKMAKGGMAKKRPMPDDTANDVKTVSKNSGDKPPKDDNALDNPTIEQAQKPSKTPLSRPKLKGSDTFSTRYKDEIDDDMHRMTSEAPTTDRAQPKKSYNEVDADASGPKVPDMQKQHNNQHQPYIKEIEDQYASDIAQANMKKIQSYAAGGMVKSGSEDMNMASGGTVESGFRDMNMAEGGMVDEDHYKAPTTLAEAIMQKRKSAADRSEQIDLSQNGSEAPRDFDAQNAMALDHDMNEEIEETSQPTDSNEHGDDIESDKHDRVAQMRKRMAKRLR